MVPQMLCCLDIFFTKLFNPSPLNLSLCKFPIYVQDVYKLSDKVYDLWLIVKVLMFASFPTETSRVWLLLCTFLTTFYFSEFDQNQPPSLLHISQVFSSLTFQVPLAIPFQCFLNYIARYNQSNGPTFGTSFSISQFCCQ